MSKKHVWRIKKEYFHQLKMGKKSLEVRVGYSQIKKVESGDIITFENYGSNEFEVRRIARYDSFEQMLKIEDVDKVLPGMTFQEALRTLQGIYPQEREKLGVYVFELRYTSVARPSKVFITASELLRKGMNKRFARVIAESYMMTDWISKDYPEHVDHFYSKYIPGIFSGEREIISCYIDDKIAGTIILKKDATERKISTFYVKSEYQKQGIATRLLEYAFKWLGTTKPLITIADYKLEQFVSIIEKYGWEETQVLDVGFYNDHSREHVFNGVA